MPMNNESIRPAYVENYLTLINWMMKNHRDTSHLLVHDDTVNRNIDELPHAVAADMLAKNVNPVELAGYVETGESDSKRRENGIHFTPAEIVHRMIDPMLIKYQARLADAKLVRDKTKRESALRVFIDDIARTRIMDPACGAGNILVETYECLRALEIDALVSLRALNADYDYTAVRVLVSSFYGIEINENIARAADASLYVACILMAHVQSDALQVTCSETMNPSHAVIVIADALDTDWNEILPASDDVMIYMNPPFIGSQRMKRTMPDMRAKVINAAVKCGASESGARRVDAAAGWLYKSALYLRDCKHASFAAITAPNVSAGLQEKSVFPVIESLGWTCNLSWASFHWKSASSDAATNVIITGFTMDASADKFAFDSDAVSLNITVPGIPSGSHVSLIDVSGAIQPVDTVSYKGRTGNTYSVPEARRELLSPELNPLFMHEKAGLKNRLVIPKNAPVNRGWLYPWYSDSVGKCGGRYAVSDPSGLMAAVSSSHALRLWHLETGTRAQGDNVNMTVWKTWNTFPLRALSDDERQGLIDAWNHALSVRESHMSEFKRWSDMYNPDKMPADLRDAYESLDAVMNTIITGKQVVPDDELLAALHGEYTRLTASTHVDKHEVKRVDKHADEPVIESVQVPVDDVAVPHVDEHVIDDVVSDDDIVQLILDGVDPDEIVRRKVAARQREIDDMARARITAARVKAARLRERIDAAVNAAVNARVAELSTSVDMSASDGVDGVCNMNRDCGSDSHGTECKDYPCRTRRKHNRNRRRSRGRRNR